MVSDAEQRRLAIDPRASYIVQAPAGSGKTELLIQRLLGLLAIVEQPREVLAITFTRKAAAEMRNRVFSALTMAAGPRPQQDYAATTWELGRRVLARDRDCGWELLDNPTQLQILTIDSFNASLVRQLPLTSGLGGTPRIEEDPAPHYRLAVRRMLRRLTTERAGIAANLLRHLDNRYDRLAQLLETLLTCRDQWLPLLLRHNPQQRRQMLEQTLCAYAVEQMQRMYDLLPAEVRNDLPLLARYADETLGGDGWNGLVELAALGRCPLARVDELEAWRGLAGLLLTENGSWRRRPDRRCGFPAGDGLAAERKALLLTTLDQLESLAGSERQLALLRALPLTRYADEQWSILEALIELLPLAAAELWLVFNEVGAVDFIEVALRALGALGAAEDPTDLLLKLDARLRHILIDEFQDTSRLQWLLLERLTSGWTAGDGRTLFLVGDPMQSIYRFREAEVGLFLRARAKGVGDLRLQGLQLQCNFRSRPDLVDWVNKAFSGMFPLLEDEGLGAVPFAAAGAVREPSAADVRLHPSFGRDDLAEAEQVVELVRQALAAESGTVAVLVRARTHLPTILAALRSAGISYQGRDLDPLVDRPAARDVISLTRAILHPGDRLHWLAILRAPWCGLTAADLHAVAGGVSSQQQTILERLDDAELATQLSVDGMVRLQRLRESLQGAIAARGRVSLRRLVEGCWLNLGGPCCVDAAGLDDVHRVLSLLEEVDYGGDILSWQQLQERLTRLFADPDPTADGRLQVMTIHKAKGLEFDTVILPGLGRKPRRTEQKILRWLDHPTHGLLLAPLAPADGRSRDPVYDLIGRMEHQKDDYETMRLLYVAATRAREQLHLLGHARIDRQGDPVPEDGSFLSLLWPVCQQFFVRINPVMPTECDVQISSAEGLRRLSVDWKQPEFTPTHFPTVAAAHRPSQLHQHNIASFELVDPSADVGRQIGSTLHVWLERLVDAVAQGAVESLLNRAEANVRADLQGPALTGKRLDSAAQTVLLGLRTAANGDRGRWIMSAHEEAACEFPLSGIVAGTLVHAVVDRTFVEQGTRWIIDYKTGSPSGASMSRFLDAEMTRYASQLELYVRLFQLFEPGRKIRAGLYFPLVDGWIEWAGTEI